MSGNDGFRTIRTGRTVSQSAVRTGSIPPSLRGLPLGFMDEAVVLATYFPEDETRPWVKGGVQRSITCDVRTLGPEPRFFGRLPVYQLLQGVQDEDVMVPRQTSKALDGTTLVTEATGVEQPTDGHVMDGDHVLIGFLRNDKEKAFIFPIGIPHPKSVNYPMKADGRVRRIRHHGTKIEIDSSGNVTIDASLAAKEELASDGGLQDDPAGGTVTIKAKSGKVIKLDSDLTELSEGATQAVVLGDDLKAMLDELLTALAAFVPAALSPVAISKMMTAITNLQLATYLSSKAKVG